MKQLEKQCKNCRYQPEFHQSESISYSSWCERGCIYTKKEYTCLYFKEIPLAKGQLDFFREVREINTFRTKNV